MRTDGADGLINALSEIPKLTTDKKNYNIIKTIIFSIFRIF